MESREIKLLEEAMAQYCMQNVWNEIQKEDRINVKPMLMSASPLRRTFTYQAVSFDLPTTTDSYRIFAVANIFSGAHSRFFDNGWIDTATVCNKHNLLIHAYRLDGKMLQKSGVFIRNVPNNNYMLIAIEDAMWRKIMGTSTDLRLTRYYDSDNHEQIVTSFKVTSAGIARTTRTFANDVLRRYPNGTMIYINGEIHKNVDDIAYTSGTVYVDIIEDQDVVGQFYLDIALGNYGYFSEKDSCDKLLIHIPKSLNPNNALVTHNTCTLYVTRKSDGVGVYLHRCAENGITQITHNDIAIKDDVLRAFVTDADFGNYQIRVQVRTHQKDNVLIPDASYINYLYSETDEKIVDHLRGQIATSLYFWKASELEYSSYIALMLDISDIYITDLDFSYYLNTFGYYSTANLMCKHVRSYKVSDKFAGLTRIPKPYILYGKVITPSVFLDGIRLRSANVTYTENLDNTISISIKNTPYTVGQRFDVSMITGQPPTIIRFSPSPGNNVIVIPYTDFLVYSESSITGVTSIHTDVDKGYREIVQTAGTIQKEYNDDGTVTVTVGNSLLGMDLLFFRAEYASIYTNDLTDEISSGKPLTIDLTLNDGQGLVIPTLGVKSTDVYLNGKYLVEDIDYFYLQRRVDGMIVSTQIIITSFEYCSDSLTNYVEVVAHTTDYIAVVNGYVVDQKLGNVGKLVQWYDGQSTVYENGKLYTDIKDHSRYMTIPNATIGEGEPYEICTRIPRTVHDLLSSVYPYVDEKLDAINVYFGNTREPTPDLVLIHEKHRVYSPYLQLIVYDLINGILEAGYDPNTISFLSQFEAYDYLKDTDVTLLNNRTAIDPKYVGIMATYRDMGYQNLDIYRIVQRLITLYLGSEY